MSQRPFHNFQGALGKPLGRHRAKIATKNRSPFRVMMVALSPVVEEQALSTVNHRGPVALSPAGEEQALSTVNRRGVG